MVAVDGDGARSGVILVRAWVDDGRLVARVTSSAGNGASRTDLVVGADEVGRVVREWLEEVTEPPAPPPGPPSPPAPGA